MTSRTRAFLVLGSLLASLGGFAWLLFGYLS